ncbi:MAG: PAS domain-containing protein [Micropepsaceae bacterium]
MGSFQGLLETDAMLGDQREVYEYWLRLKRGEEIPARCDFSPAAIVRRLPMVSLIDVGLCARRFRFRLAGTGLRQVFGEELTGRYLNDIAFGEQAAFWREIYDGIADDAAPAQGYTKLAWREKPAVLQAWLRLPLAGPDGRVTTILGYDRFLPMERMTARPRAAEPARIYATAM